MDLDEGYIEEERKTTTKKTNKKRKKQKGFDQLVTANQAKRLKIINEVIASDRLKVNKSPQLDGDLLEELTRNQPKDTFLFLCKDLLKLLFGYLKLDGWKKCRLTCSFLHHLIDRYFTRTIQKFFSPSDFKAKKGEVVTSFSAAVFNFCFNDDHMMTLYNKYPELVVSLEFMALKTTSLTIPFFGQFPPNLHTLEIGSTKHLRGLHLLNLPLLEVLLLDKSKANWLEIQAIPEAIKHSLRRLSVTVDKDEYLWCTSEEVEEDTEVALTTGQLSRMKPFSSLERVTVISNSSISSIDPEFFDSLPHSLKSMHIRKKGSGPITLKSFAFSHMSKVILIDVSLSDESFKLLPNSITQLALANTTNGDSMIANLPSRLIELCLINIPIKTDTFANLPSTIQVFGYLGYDVTDDIFRSTPMEIEVAAFTSFDRTLTGSIPPNIKKIITQSFSNYLRCAISFRSTPFEPTFPICSKPCGHDSFRFTRFTERRPCMERLLCVCSY